jgi:hypothetical protein
MVLTAGTYSALIAACGFSSQLVLNSMRKRPAFYRT